MGQDQPLSPTPVLRRLRFLRWISSWAAGILSTVAENPGAVCDLTVQDASTSRAYGGVIEGHMSPTVYEIAASLPQAYRHAYLAALAGVSRCVPLDEIPSRSGGQDDRPLRLPSNLNSRDASPSTMRSGARGRHARP